MLKTIFKEAMLNGVAFGNNNSIKFEFYNSETGVDIGSVVCKGIALFKYSTSLLLNEESIPYFVLDVTCEETNKFGITSYLKNNQFSFYQQNGEPAITEKDLYYVFKIQGGGIDVIVICHEFEKIN